MNAPRFLADLIVLIHAAYVAFVVVGLLAIAVGLILRRPWARNFWLRFVHLAMMGIVVVETWLNIPCPLTIWENRLRVAGGQEANGPGFIEYWLHKILFFRLPSWAFVLMYSTFGLAVLLTFVLAPPRWPRAATSPPASRPPTPN